MSKELMERKNDLITRAEAVLNAAKDANRELTDDEAAELDGIKADVQRITRTLELANEFGKMEMRKKEDDTPMEDKEVMTKEQEVRATEIAEERAFEAFVRGRVLNERDADVNMTYTDNGAVIPTTIARRIIKKVYDLCPILERSDRYNVKGKLELPYYPYDESTDVAVDYQDEFEELTSSVGKFASIQLDGFLAGALVKISRSLINNAEFNIVDFIVDHMAEAIRRWIEKELLNGTDDKIEGLSGATNTVTAAAENAITADELVKLHDAIKDVYQRDAIWIMSPATRTACRLLKDDKGQYMLNDDISTPFGASILGKPVFVSDNMPDMTGDARAIYYGDMKALATKFSENMNVQILRERFATQHAVGVVGWVELDAKVQNQQSIACLVMA